MKHNKNIIKSLKNTSKGFTLIELIITVIAIGVFGSITANILANASKIYSETLNKQKFVSRLGQQMMISVAQKLSTLKAQIIGSCSMIFRAITNYD